MSIYLLRGKYSAEAFKGMLAKPEDRTAAIKAFYEAAGVKLLHALVCTIVGRIHRDYGGNADSGHATWNRVDGYRHGHGRQLA